MLECAYENKVLFMEAYKTLAMPGYDFLTEAVRNIGQIRSVLFNFCQYSSRYDSYLNGAHVNAFNPQFSGGSLMDLGIYCIYPMVSLFGLPEKYYGNSTLLASGSDCEGSSIFRYKNFTVTLIYSKASDSYISNQIQGEKGTILIDKISSPQKIDVIYRNGQKKTYENKCENDMVYEVSEFITCAEKGFMQSNINNHYLSLSVLDIMDGLRKKANIKYPADSFIN